MPQRLTDDEVADIFIKKLLQKRTMLSMTPRKCLPVSLNEAAQLCSVGTVGATVTDLLTLQEQGDRRDLQDWLDKHMSQIIGFSMVVGVIILGLFIISKYVV
jgi:hypothetical protein